MESEENYRDRLLNANAEDKQSHNTMSEQHPEVFHNETMNDNAKSLKQQRICLVGAFVDDPDVATVANRFNVPVLRSPTGEELVSDDSWCTYFILPEFEGQLFDNLCQSQPKHKILGAPALAEASTADTPALPSHIRPIYNYSMRGIVTAFTGIRKRDELTKLVNVIHFMGGSIRKELNTKATHLISTNAYGEKYRYALTFRLNVVRSSWVLEAWNCRNEQAFSAKSETFTAEHRLKIFEGCRVAFIGFPDMEKANMVDLLRKYNGIETSSDDDTCTHKIIADCPVFSNEPNNATLDCSTAFNEDLMENEDEDEDNDDYACRVIQRKHESFLRHFEQSEKECGDLGRIVEEDELTKSNHLEVSTQPYLEVTTQPSTSQDAKQHSRDGAVLCNEEDAFSITQNISPILKSDQDEKYDAFPNDSIYDDGFRDKKRKRAGSDSPDNASFMSVESTKKLKLNRAGSLTKTIGRRMSISLVKPINNLFKSRRNSADVNSSSCSNFETTFNESMKSIKSLKEPFKEKFRQIKDKVCKQSKKDNFTTPKSTKSKLRMASTSLINTNDVCIVHTKTPEKNFDAPIEFKTPKALPFPSISSASKFSKPRCKLDESIVGDTSKLVIEETSIRYDHAGPDDQKFFVVKCEWFWTRIAEGYAPEDDFLYKDYMQSVRNEQAEQYERRDSFINYSAKAQRKRRRLSRIVLDGTPVSAGKRRSSVSDAGILSESFIDYTASPVDKNDSVKHEETTPAKKFSMRHNHFMDFYHTESNYVGILETIVKLFKTPLEQKAEENQDNPDGDDMLNKAEMKTIFSNFLPIYQVHKKMLNSLQEINGSWKEDTAIGQIILDNEDSLLKAYPPYINSFEQMKAELIKCTQSKPRFQAFLKINQAKPECGRQSLQELMIRPVQRLPSISLLLNDILKHTPKTNRDHEYLTDALTKIKTVMTHINEDKRKTEGQKQMFNIFNEIENCPPHLISSHRSFVSRCEVTELSETLSGRGDSLLLYLFTDTLEICKKRSRYNQSKSPNSTGLKSSASSTKPCKHIKLIPLSSIRTLADISDSQKAFAISLRNSSNFQDLSKDKLYSFSISDEEVDKTIFIKNFCKQLAENACRTDAEKFVVSVQSQEIGIDIQDVNLGTLSRAFRLATRTRMKVGRAFSFNKTPSRKRNNVASPFGSNVSLTPSTISSMSHLKLQSSCMTLNEFDLDRKEAHELYHVVPLTDQMARKNKKVAMSDE